MLPTSLYSDVLDILGRVDLGYNTTPADGTCGYIAPLQAMLMDTGLPDDAVLPSAQASLEFVLRDVGIAMCEIPALRATWTGDEKRQLFFNQLNKQVDEANQLKDDATDDQVKNLVQKTGKDKGPWICSHLIGALAIVLKRDIVVVAKTTVTLFPRVAGQYSLGDAEPGTSTKPSALGITGHSIASNEGWIPFIAFMPSTLVIVFDNKGHFWCTRRSADHDADKLMAAFGVERVKMIYID